MSFIECKRSASLPSEFFCWYRSNKSFKPTNNAWHFWFAVNLVFKAQCSSLFCALSAV
ncbi:DUF3265 domain-containing protein [Vibrio sp. S9_S30]|nr:DUF3265 domain-containing protein [Vibrio sp. S9_S30]